MATSVGIEIGATSVRAVRLRSVSCQLLECAEVPIREHTEEALRHALTQVRKTLKIQQPVIVAVPTDTAIVTTLEPLVVNRERAALAVEFELQQQLPYDVRQAAWDMAWDGPPGGAHRAVVVAMKQSVMAMYVTACRQAGLIVAGLTLGGIGAANAWLRARLPAAQQVASRQAGERDLVHSDAPPAGLPTAQEAVGRQAGTFLHTPGVLLRIEGASGEWIVISNRTLNKGTFQVVPLLAPIDAASTPALHSSWEAVEQILRENDQPLDSVWLIGEAAAQPVWAQTVASLCGCTVQVVDPTHVVELGPTPPASPERLMSACGVALQGLGNALLSVNVLAHSVRRQQRARIVRVIAMCNALWLAITIGCGAFAMQAMWSARRAALQAVIRQEQLYKTLRPEAQALLKQQRRVEERLTQLAHVLEAHRAMLPAFHRLVEALPDDVWLTKADLSQREAFGAVQATVEGYAKSFQSVNRFMEQLKTSGAWANVKPLATTVTNDPATAQQVIAFTIQARPDEHSKH